MMSTKHCGQGMIARASVWLPRISAAIVIALVLLPLNVAADDPNFVVPSLRDPGSTSGTFSGFPSRNPSTILSTNPDDTNPGRPSSGPGWTWQDDSSPFTHSQSFSGTVNSGEEDGAVEYQESPYRRAWAEGSYLTWMQSDIDALKGDALCFTNPTAFGCPAAGYTLGAAVFHAFNKNSGTSNALQNNGWTYSNLPDPPMIIPSQKKCVSTSAIRTRCLLPRNTTRRPTITTPPITPARIHRSRLRLNSTTQPISFSSLPARRPCPNFGTSMPRFVSILISQSDGIRIKRVRNRRVRSYRRG